MIYYCPVHCEFVLVCKSAHFTSQWCNQYIKISLTCGFNAYKCTLLFFFQNKCLDDTNPFCGGTDTLLWVSSDVCSGFQNQDRFLGCVLSRLCDPQIHLWCNTCWLYRSQHAGQAFLIHLLADHVSISTGGGLNSWPCMLQHSAVNHSATPV